MIGTVMSSFETNMQGAISIARSWNCLVWPWIHPRNLRLRIRVRDLIAQAADLVYARNDGRREALGASVEVKQQPGRIVSHDSERTCGIGCEVVQCRD